MREIPVKTCFPPSVDTGCTKLILGSMPGEESLRRQQYYAHPRNAFWPLLGRLLDFPPDLPYVRRLERLRTAGIALWDTVGQGIRPGSLDSHITLVEPNDFTLFLSKYPKIIRIFFNGKTAYNFFIKYNANLNNKNYDLYVLPSSSPAYAVLNFEQKLQKWAILNML